MARKSKKYDYDLIVLGSGGGGNVAAYASLREGKKVAVVEPAEMGGECPNWGCVPTKSLLYAAEIYDKAKHAENFGINGRSITYNYPSIKEWKDLAVHRTGTFEGKEVFEASGIKVIRGSGRFIGPHEITVNRQRYSAKKFLIATGTHNFIPPIEGLAEAGYLTFKEAINLKKPPKSLFVIGAGPIGCEFSELFSIFGAKIYLSDLTPRLMMKEDVEVSDLAQKHFEQKRGATVLMGSKVVKVEKHGRERKIHYQKDGKNHTVTAEQIMLATGKLANVDIGLENAGVSYTSKYIEVNDFMQTTAKHIYAAGDVVGPYMFTHMAEYQSRLAAHNMWHRKQIPADYRAVPRCVFINPEIASVGASEEDCKQHKFKYKTAIAPISRIGRANTSNVEDGFVKVITKPDGTLIGASIVSPRAGEMLHELTLAIQTRQNARTVAATHHAFPTWSEAVRLACAKIK